MAEEIGDVPVPPLVDDQEDAPGYQAPPQKSIAEILQADEDDESLRKYKAALLGSDAEPIIVGELYSCASLPLIETFISLALV